ncbi:hypothetical protein LINPERHAP1_LOCUS30680 [Linum perenne]
MAPWKRVRGRFSHGEKGIKFFQLTRQQKLILKAPP